MMVHVRWRRPDSNPGKHLSREESDADLTKQSGSPAIVEHAHRERQAKWNSSARGLGNSRASRNHGARRQGNVDLRYPDATFTLRLAYGTVKGYPFNGTVAPPRTTLYGLYDRSAGFGGYAPFDLPPRFVKEKDALVLSTPLNFVSTADIIGGNSGSPVVNRDGELVGLIFDGNIESLVGRFVYDGRANRAVAVHPGAITEALAKVYGAAPLVAELQGRPCSGTLSGTRPAPPASVGATL